MPTLPKRIRRPWEPEPAPRSVQGRRRTDNSKFYTSAPWRKLRAVKLTRNPLCEACERRGRITPASVVDHIRPIARGGQPLALENLQSLCNRCHNRKSGKEAHSGNENDVDY